VPVTGSAIRLACNLEAVETPPTGAAPVRAMFSLTSLETFGSLAPAQTRVTDASSPTVSRVARLAPFAHEWADQL
jgi:hypothetical protein